MYLLLAGLGVLVILSIRARREGIFGWSASEKEAKRVEKAATNERAREALRANDRAKEKAHYEAAKDDRDKRKAELKLIRQSFVVKVNQILKTKHVPQDQVQLFLRDLGYCLSERQCADLYKKFYTSAFSQTNARRRGE